MKLKSQKTRFYCDYPLRSVLAAKHFWVAVITSWEFLHSPPHKDYCTERLNRSSIVKIYLFLLIDNVSGPMRSRHKMSLTFFAHSSKGLTFFKFTSSLCRQPAHSVTKRLVSFLHPGQRNTFLPGAWYAVLPRVHVHVLQSELDTCI